MAKNSNLHAAKKAKNDEFYTRLEDICAELINYKDHFKGKTVFLNCDDPEESNFWKYFELNFDNFGLKKLVSTHYDSTKPTYKLELIGDIDNDGVTTNKDIIKTPLLGNGDFRSAECIEILKEADIVVTNPPFSLFREYIAQLMEYQKKFLIIGNNNAITYKEVFPLIKDNKIWLGTVSNISMQFSLPKGETATKLVGKDALGREICKVPSISWFTNLSHKKRNEKMILFRKYYDDPTKYPKYDNYDAINVDKVADIPMDYKGIMGVPITFLGKYNPKQFEIVGLIAGNIRGLAGVQSKIGKDGPYINGKLKYGRILIKVI